MGYIVVEFPQSQILDSKEGFFENCELLNSDVALNIYGGSAYLVDEDWYRDVLAGNVADAEYTEEEMEEKLVVNYSFPEDDEDDDEDDWEDDIAEFNEGDLVKWNDPAINDFEPEEREIQRNRIYSVVKIINEDMVLIADEWGEGEVFVDELELVKQ